MGLIREAQTHAQREPGAALPRLFFKGKAETIDQVTHDPTLGGRKRWMYAIAHNTGMISSERATTSPPRPPYIDLA